MTDTFPVTTLPRTGLPDAALVVGDPARAEVVAARLDDGREVASNREYRSFQGRWQGEEVLVVSHGVGAPGAILPFQELADAGVGTILRLGTTGALAAHVGVGDLVIAEAAVRDDGVTDQQVPVGYPASATPEVVLALVAAAARHELTAHRGVVWTRAALYPGVVPLPLEAHRQLGVLAIEMELSALLVVGARSGVRVGGVLVVDGRVADELVETTGYDPHTDAVRTAVVRSVDVALDALVEVMVAGR